MKAQISLEDLTHAVMFFDNIASLAERAVALCDESQRDTMLADFSLTCAALLTLIEPWFTDSTVKAMTNITSSDVGEILSELRSAKNERDYQKWYRFANDLWTVCRETRDSVEPLV